MAEANKDVRTLVLNDDSGESVTYAVADMTPEAQNIYNKLTLVQQEVSKLSFELEQKNFAQMGYIGAIKAHLTSDEETEDNEDVKKQNTK